MQNTNVQKLKKFEDPVLDAQIEQIVFALASIGLPVIGHIYENGDPGPYNSISIVTAGQYYQWITGTVHNDLRVTAVAADGFTVEEPGHYLVAYGGSIEAATASEAHASVFKNDGQTSAFDSEVLLSANKEANIANIGYIDLEKDDTLDLRFTDDTSSTTLDIHHMSFLICRMATFMEQQP